MWCGSRDQNGTIHEYLFDPLGRPVCDRVTTLGSNIDDAIQRITRTYEIRGMIATLTSHDAPSSGNIVNQVTYEYTNTGQLHKEYQSHSGPKESNTPYVGHNYSDSTQGYRPTSTRYPNGRLVHTTYGTTNSTDDILNRTSTISDDTNGSPGDPLAEYQYLGRSSIIQLEYPEPDIHYTPTLDRFGRITDLLWHNATTSTDLVHIRHGYDRANNRLYREDPIAASYSKNFDELYTYDGLNRLIDMQRGDLNSSKDAILPTTKTFAEDWSLDATGNWPTYRQDTNGDSTWNLNQTRTHNPANELTHLSNSSTHLSHDACGNMARTPQPSNPTTHFHLTYDAWNRLVTIHDADSSTIVEQYGYDGRGRRIVKQTDYSGGTPQDTYNFYYNRKYQIVEEHLDGDANPQSQYAWHPYYIDAVAMRWYNPDTNGTNLQTQHYVHDANVNVVAVYHSGCQPLEHYHYRPYGRVTILDANFTPTLNNQSQIKNPYTYTGRRLDEESGLYYYRARYYHAQLGRFVNRDQIGYRGGINLYCYVHNSPLTFVDPFGRDYWVENTTAVNGWHRRICVDTYDNKCNKTGKYCVSFGLMDVNNNAGSSGSGSSNNGGSSDSDSSGDSSTSGEEGNGNQQVPLPGGNENPEGDGIVYVDTTDPVTREVERATTNCGCDAAILDYLQSMVGTRGDFGAIFGENCRDFSAHTFDEITERIENGDITDDDCGCNDDGS